MSNVTSNNNVNDTGFISATIVTIMTVVFAITLVMDFWVQTDVISYAVCFILAPAFVSMIISIHYSTPKEKQIWSQIGIAFAVIYAVFILMVYYIQLAVVTNNPRNFSPDILEPFIYSNIGSIMFSLNLLGYAFMALSTFVTAPVFSSKSKLEKWIKRLFIFHGLFFFSTIIFPLLPLPQDMLTPTGSDYFGAIVLIFWCVVFTPLPSLVCINFYQKKML